MKAKPARRGSKPSGAGLFQLKDQSVEAAFCFRALRRLALIRRCPQSCGRVAAGAQTIWGVRLSLSRIKVVLVLHGLGFSCQYPQQRAPYWNGTRKPSVNGAWSSGHGLKKSPTKRGTILPGSITGAALCCNPPVVQHGLCGATRPLHKVGIRPRSLVRFKAAVTLASAPAVGCLFPTCMSIIHCKLWNVLRWSLLRMIHVVHVLI